MSDSVIITAAWERHRVSKRESAGRDHSERQGSWKPATAACPHAILQLYKASLYLFCLLIQLSPNLHSQMIEEKQTNNKKTSCNYMFEILTWIKAEGQGWQPQALILFLFYFCPEFLHMLTSKEIYIKVGTTPWIFSFQGVNSRVKQ